MRSQGPDGRNLNPSTWEVEAELAWAAQGDPVSKNRKQSKVHEYDTLCPIGQFFPYYACSAKEL